MYFTLQLKKTHVWFDSCHPTLLKMKQVDAFITLIFLPHLPSVTWGRAPSAGGGWFHHLCDVCRSGEDSEDESLSHGGRQNHDNLYRVHMPSLYSCGSSYGSETSIPAAAHTVSNAPVTEYM